MKKSDDSVESAKRLLLSITEDANDMLKSLPEDTEDCLPVWWTNKLSISYAYLNSLRDYLLYSDLSEESDELEEEEPISQAPVETNKIPKKLKKSLWQWLWDNLN